MLIMWLKNKTIHTDLKSRKVNFIKQIWYKAFRKSKFRYQYLIMLNLGNPSRMLNKT